jgi:hypothetical protein
VKFSPARDLLSQVPANCCGREEFVLFFGAAAIVRAKRKQQIPHRLKSVRDDNNKLIRYGAAKAVPLQRSLRAFNCPIGIFD